MAVLSGYFVGAFVAALVVPIVWLLVTKAIPPMRRRVGVSYGVAIVLAVLSAFVGSTASAMPAVTVVGGVAAVAVLFWQWTRAKRAASTTAGQTSTG